MRDKGVQVPMLKKLRMHTQNSQPYETPTLRISVPSPAGTGLFTLNDSG